MAYLSFIGVITRIVTGPLDAEFMTLVEIKNEAHLQGLVNHLADDGVEYEYTFMEQSEPGGQRKPMHIGALYKKGVSVTNAFLMDGSDLGETHYDECLCVKSKLISLILSSLVCT